MSENKKLLFGLVLVSLCVLTVLVFNRYSKTASSPANKPKKPDMPTMIPSPQGVRSGCTDPTALNYEPEAVADNGLCEDKPKDEWISPPVQYKRGNYYGIGIDPDAPGISIQVSFVMTEAGIENLYLKLSNSNGSCGSTFYRPVSQTGSFTGKDVSSSISGQLSEDNKATGEYTISCGANQGMATTSSGTWSAEWKPVENTLLGRYEGVGTETQAYFDLNEPGSVENFKLNVRYGHSTCTLGPISHAWAVDPGDGSFHDQSGFNSPGTHITGIVVDAGEAYGSFTVDAEGCGASQDWGVITGYWNAGIR